MKRLFALTLILSGCAASVQGPDMRPPEGMLHPAPRPGDAAVAPPADAATVDAFDTTTAAERAAASAAPQAGVEQKLGETVASLGNPADPGFWLETPLTDRIRKGRVVAESGESVTLELRPIDGPASAGSRISLPALRLLGVGLTGLHRLSVFGL